jgi:adenosylcobyric acid synthase
VFESDAFRRAFLCRIAWERGLDWVAGGEPFAARREAQLDALGDLVAEHIEREALLRLIEDGLVSSQQSAVSSQLVGRASEPPRAVASQDEAGTPRESTAASAQAVRSVAEANLEAES